MLVRDWFLIFHSCLTFPASANVYPLIVNELKCASQPSQAFFIACVCVCCNEFPSLPFFIHSNYLIVRWIKIGGTAWHSSPKRQAIRPNELFCLVIWLNLVRISFHSHSDLPFLLSTLRRPHTKIQARATDIFRNTRHNVQKGAFGLSSYMCTVFTTANEL